MLKKLKADAKALIPVLTAVTYTVAKKPRPPKYSQTREQIKNRQNVYRVGDRSTVHSTGEP